MEEDEEGRERGGRADEEEAIVRLDQVLPPLLPPGRPEIGALLVSLPVPLPGAAAAEQQPAPRASMVLVS